ncbi:MAG: YitT family protein [Bacteroidales bacterium]|jgi:uncharacterized membrane-anchored protein YitT (DUF2179 family)|nr:YitT family protein [Bacteroidales bacterium]
MKFKINRINFRTLNYKQLAIEYGAIVLGTFIMAVGFVIFVSPLKLAPGGVYGVAIILHHLFNFPIGLSGICLDIPLLIIGTLWLGPKFGIKTVIGIVSLSGSITLLEHLYGYNPLIGMAGNPTLPDPAANFIIALFGGAIIGLGLGIIFKTRATSGGTDIVAMILGKYLKHIPLGTLIIIVDSTVVLLALAVFNDWTIPLYSWLIIYVSGVVIDKVIAGFAGGKALIIISDYYDEIKERILTDLERGGTFLHGEGMYNNMDKKIIFTSISRKQLPVLIHFVHEIDPKAFISIMDSSETLGEGFASLREKVEHR